jgi:hypothetical protein
VKPNLLLAVLILLLASCTSAALTPPGEVSPARVDAPDLTDQGPAPELHNQTWLNTDQPLRLADLRGKVVLLEMWTFG